MSEATELSFEHVGGPLDGVVMVMEFSGKALESIKLGPEHVCLDMHDLNDDELIEFFHSIRLVSATCDESYLRRHWREYLGDGERPDGTLTRKWKGPAR